MKRIIIVLLSIIYSFFAYSQTQADFIRIAKDVLRIAEISKDEELYNQISIEYYYYQIVKSHIYDKSSVKVIDDAFDKYKNDGYIKEIYIDVNQIAKLKGIVIASKSKEIDVFLTLLEKGYTIDDFYIKGIGDMRLIKTNIIPSRILKK